jgi:hypothetical protein
MPPTEWRLPLTRFCAGLRVAAAFVIVPLERWWSRSTMT